MFPGGPSLPPATIPAVCSPAPPVLNLAVFKFPLVLQEPADGRPGARDLRLRDHPHHGRERLRRCGNQPLGLVKYSYLDRFGSFLDEMTAAGPPSTPAEEDLLTKWVVWTHVEATLKD